MIRSGIIAMLISVFEPCGTIRHNGLWTLPDYESFGVKVMTSKLPDVWFCQGTYVGSTESCSQPVLQKSRLSVLLTQDKEPKGRRGVHRRPKLSVLVVSTDICSCAVQ